MWLRIFKFHANTNPFPIFGAMNVRWLFLLLILVACDDYTECGVTDTGEEIYINFYNIETKAAREVVFTPMEVTFPSTGSTIPFVDDQEGGSAGYIFPLDLSSTNTTMVFNTDTIDYDLSIGYSTKAFIENPDCGPIFLVRNITAQSMAFDSVVVRVTELSKNLAPHVEIYF